jgi:hypothetical protein
MEEVTHSCVGLIFVAGMDERKVNRKSVLLDQGPFRLRFVVDKMAQGQYFASPLSVRFHRCFVLIFIVIVFILLFSTYAPQPSRLIVRSGLDVPTFSHQASPRVSPRESTQRRKVEL